MATTPNYEIVYPDGASQVTPIQAPFAALASSVDTALLEVASSIPNQSVANAAARDALYPNPQQGNSVYRIDKGWTERYYNVYNASTNPGGTLLAGWHAIDFKPGAAAGQPFTATAGWQIVSEFGRRFGPLAFVATTIKRTGAKITVPDNGNIGNIKVADVASAWAGLTGAPFPMMTTNTGRVIAAGLDGTALNLSALSNLYDIATNESFSFSGFYILANP